MRLNARRLMASVMHLPIVRLERRHMKRLLLIALLASVSSAPALAQSGTERKVLKLYKEYEEAIARRDASVHERLFADDYTYTPGTGNFMGRTEHMKFTKSGARGKYQGQTGLTYSKL